MAVELTIEAFEKNAKNFNKKGLIRQYYSIHNHAREYVNGVSIAATKKFVLEVTIDKESVVKFIDFLKNEGFRVLGSENYYYLENIMLQYNLNKANLSNVDPKAFEAIGKDLDLMKEKNKDYKDVENDDAVFYFLPYNEGIETIFEFVKTKKDAILKFAKDNDITIMFKFLAYTNQVDGFLGFNFFDADKPEEDVIIDYASRITIMANCASRDSVFSAGLLLAGIGESAEELLDSDINVHILAENAKFTK